MFIRLLLAFTLVPLIELYLLLSVHRYLGTWATIALVFGTGLLGATLAKSQGTRVFARMRREMEAGQVPTEALLDGLLIFVAGAVLLTPGLMTDVTGFLLLIPAGRRVVREAITARLSRRFATRSNVIVIER
jgi:UPF0716 protein FxsA